MTPQNIIEAVQNHAKEYLEMTSNPDAMVSGILAHKVIELLDHVVYLESRIKYYERNRSA